MSFREFFNMLVILSVLIFGLIKLGEVLAYAGGPFQPCVWPNTCHEVS